MRIALFVGEFPHPAATPTIRRAIDLLARDVDARIVAVRPSHARVEQEAVHTHRLLERTLYRDGEPAPLAFDVVHVEGKLHAEASRLRAAGVLSGALVISLPRLGGPEESAALASADRIIVRTHAAAQQLYGRGCARARVDIVPPPVDLDISRARRRPGRPRRLLSVGTLDDGKRLRAAIHAHADRRWHDVVHDIVGDGSARRDLEQLAAQLDVAERVRFHGWCSWRRVSALLDAADLFVLLGGDALPLREAQAAGVPVIATTGAETAEIVRDGDTGLLVPPEDASTLAHAIDWMLDDAPNYRRTSRGAQLHAAAAWDRTKHADALVSCCRTARRG